MKPSAASTIDSKILRQLVLAEIEHDVLIAKADKHQGNTLYNTLLDVLIDKPERIAEFKANTLGTAVILHSGSTLKNGQVCHLANYYDSDDGQMEVLHIAMGAENLWPNIKQVFENIAKPSVDESVTGHQLLIGSGLNSQDGATSTGMDGGGGSIGDYDIDAELRKGKAHTSGQLNREAHRRIGLEYEDTDPREKKQAFDWLNKTNERWQQAEVDEETNPINTELHQARRKLWKDKLDLLLSDEFLQKKSPERWFRDICVICSVSTPALAELSEEGYQPHWHNTQTTPTPYRQFELKALRMALSIHLPTPKRAGYGKNTGRGIGYYLPAGSVFGLPVITQEKNGKEKTIIDPAAVESLLKKLFIEKKMGDNGKEILIDHYHPPFEPAHTLKQLKQISDAWQQGKLTSEEVIAERPIRGDSKLYQIVQHYGLSYLYPHDSDEYKQLKSIKYLGSNITSLCETLYKLNEDKWHIPKPEFDEIIKSLSWLAASETELFHTDEKRPADKAWEFAKIHHGGTIGNLLDTYAHTHGYSQPELAKRVGNSREAISQYARGNRSEESTINRVFSKETIPNGKKFTGRQIMIEVNGVKQLENMWLLPTEPNDPNTLRADVVEYLEQRKFKDPIPSPASYWVNIMNVLDDLADTPATTHLDTGEFRSYVVMGQWTESLRKPKEHSVLGALQEALVPFADESLPLIALGGQEYLVKHTENGEVMFQQSDLERLRPWLLEQAQLASINSWGNTVPSSSAPKFIANR